MSEKRESAPVDGEIGAKRDKLLPTDLFGSSEILVATMLSAVIRLRPIPVLY